MLHDCGPKQLLQYKPVDQIASASDFYNFNGDFTHIEYDRASA
jgi:hypothetical protein